MEKQNFFLMMSLCDFFQIIVYKRGCSPTDTPVRVWLFAVKDAAAEGPQREALPVFPL